MSRYSIAQEVGVGLTAGLFLWNSTSTIDAHFVNDHLTISNHHNISPQHTIIYKINLI